MTGEEALTGGRVTRGVVRAGETVRRPRRTNSAFVRDLLRLLMEQGFDAAPRYLGDDELGRETFSYIPGDVPPDLDPNLSDDMLAAGARLIRRFHDATAGSLLAGSAEVVCHNDLSPCNFVFRDSIPIGVIDFDDAAPGERRQDVGYALFLWLNLGTDGSPPREQARRIDHFCDAYGVGARADMVDAVLDAVASAVDRLTAQQRRSDAEWWNKQLAWLTANRSVLCRPLGSRASPKSRRS